MLSEVIAVFSDPFKGGPLKTYIAAFLLRDQPLIFFYLAKLRLEVGF